MEAPQEFVIDKKGMLLSMIKDHTEAGIKWTSSMYEKELFPVREQENGSKIRNLVQELNNEEEGFIFSMDGGYIYTINIALIRTKIIEPTELLHSKAEIKRQRILTKFNTLQNIELNRASRYVDGNIYSQLTGEMIFPKPLESLRQKKQDKLELEMYRARDLEEGKE